MDPMTIGIVVVMVIFGIAAFFLYSAASGPTTLLRALGVSSGAGIVGSIVAVFTDAYKFIVASAYGHLGFYGYIFIFGLALCLIVWMWNGYQDLRKNRPLSFVD